MSDELMVDQDRSNSGVQLSGPTVSEESSLDFGRGHCNRSSWPSLSSQSLQPQGLSAQYCENNAAYFSWPCRIKEDTKERANHFANLQKRVPPRRLGHPEGQRASTLLDLITIRASHSQRLRSFSHGTAIGLRIQGGKLTDIPAVLVFVSSKVHKQWLSECLPSYLEGPGGIWCDVDIVEFSYFGAPDPPSKEQLYSEIADDLRGGDECIGSGSQVANQEKCGTLGAIVRSQTGNQQVGFLTNRHIAVDLEYPNQKMFHPLSPTLGHGVYLGSVERATSFIRDGLWFGTFAGSNPETYVRADGAFIPFAEDFDMTAVTTSVKGIGEICEVKGIDLQSPVDSLVGKKVMKVGRSSGLTTGTLLAYAHEYNDEKGICLLTDLLVVGENQQAFDLEGDSGSLILLKGENGEKPCPIGMIWGGTARGRLKLKVGQPPEHWTSGVDLGRLLKFLELDLITSNEALEVAVQAQRAASFTESTAWDSPALDMMLPRDTSEPLGLHIQQPRMEDGPAGHDLNLLPALETEANAGPSFEHQFISSFIGNHADDPMTGIKYEQNKDACKEDLSFSLQIGENGLKRRRSKSEENEQN